ncbi:MULTISPECIES: enediyne biosynthesis protein [unclassified Solwaraspora]|uniref:enediyne biosynthesis protein n=1 Tax=unclassified Solwaraspora TaxID=2627926 RepID=UPI00248BF3A5|nr:MULTISPECIES: enediyne biosynthesis protein [unclassified Solwaraspora]WBB96043.1 enediyne biosynthesis protein [Solwaraspora sp. WMMA2059]WBC20052.1 enediyne biosynthesis protein [Solwaraspora sp. WMMA2080]WJK32352.1 enediyne biosynthesis protein [Solwaraspora sp. WMMA2065]
MTTTAERQQTVGTTTAPAGPPAPAAKEPDRRYLALRNFAISMTVFNILGYTVLGFEQPWLWPILAVLVGYATELVFETFSARMQQRAPRYTGRGGRGMYEFLLPAHITALACNMLLYANDMFLPIAFAVIVGVTGKYVFQAPVYGRMRHYMNPSNLGITVALVCFGSWISIAPPYQFTEGANTFFRIMIPIIIVTAGTVINAMLTRKVALIVGWLGGFAIQALLRHWIWDVALFSALGVMAGVAFVLFTNYMITDPGTTPVKPIHQFMFGSSVAMVYGVLMLFNVVYTLFFAVVVVCGARGIYWWMVHLRKRAQQQAAVAPAPAPVAGATA